MGKDTKAKHFRHAKRNRKPYSKDDDRKNQKHRHTNKSQDDGRTPYTRRDAAATRINLREDEVGITEFVSKHPGFVGIVKSRFSDFHVNEIDATGKVLVLDDLTVPKPADDSLSAEQLEEARQEISDVIDSALWARIKSLAEAKASDSNAQPIEIAVTAVDKEKRTQIHQVLKKLFAGQLVSTTVSDEAAVDAGGAKVERKLIKVMKPKPGNYALNRMRWSFPGEYVYFLVHKENVDTSEVAAAMADRLNLRPSQVNYSGTKDKRGKTTQKFCIKKRTPAQIVNSVKTMHNVHVGNFEFGSEVLKLGDLKGNRFRIALRHVSGDREQIELSLRDMRECGFINYFGLQRFGNSATVPTYKVGVALLKCDYKLACELILKPRDNDVNFMRVIREHWWEHRDAKAASDMFRNNKYIEKKVLDGLVQFGEHDYSAALRKIPRNMLLLYKHALQSLVFNRIASRRIKQFGMQVIPGDLVYRNPDEQDVDIIADLEDVTKATDDGDEEPTKDTDDGDDEPTKDTDDGDQNAAKDAETSAFKRKVKPLTAQDIASGDYSLFDVVLALPGYDVTYPENEVGAWYDEILAEYDLSSAKLRHRVKTYAMPGAYRKLLIQPSKMTWQWQQYASAESTLITSDWEQLRPSNAAGATPTPTPAVATATAAASTASEAECKYTALILDFCLPTSTYATMMLRELLKTDTSAANQTQLEQIQLKMAAGPTALPAPEARADAAAEDATKRKCEPMEGGSRGLEQDGERADETAPTKKPKPTEAEAVAV